MSKIVQDLPEEILELNKQIDTLRSVMLNTKDYQARSNIQERINVFRSMLDEMMIEFIGEEG